jgi:arylsulfatase A-like enzyme
MRWPGKIAPGRVSDLPVNSLDFYPTFMEVTQIKEPKGLDGKSLIPLMTGKAPSNASTQFWHFPIYLQAYDEILDDGRDPLFRTRPGSTLRVGNWKLHEYFEDNALELYDLENDPDERNDLSRTKPELTAQLYQQLLDWRERIKAPIPTQPNPDYDEDVEQAALEKWKNPTSL